MDARGYIEAQAREFFSDLKEWLAIPSVSADPGHHGDVRASADWLAGHLREAGFPQVEIWETGTAAAPGQPAVFACWPAADPGALTVTVYGHHDVQPVDPLDLWRALRMGAVGRRRTFDALATQFLSHSFDVPAFSLRLAHKDVGLATEFARELGIPMRMAGLTFAEMTEALARGWGDRDSRVAMLLQEERTGVHIEIPAETLRQELNG